MNGKNSNSGTDAYADGFRFRVELFGTAMNRLTPEFTKTKTEAIIRRRDFAECGIQAKILALTEDGGLAIS